MKVYIVRHGEVKHNILKSFSLNDEELTLIGVAQAENLRHRIKDIDYDAIFSSPLKRTMHTANIINYKKLDVIIDDRLKERSCGNLDGKTFNLEDKDEYWNYYTLKKYGTEEDIKEFFKRVYNFLDELKTKKYNSVIIVSHSGVTKAFQSYFDGMGDGKFSSKGLKNCEIMEYEF